MRFADWSAWKFDGWTTAWLVWLAAFGVLETWTLVNHSHNELTAHLRPLFQLDPLTWFMALGVWLWLGYHFLIQGVFVKV